MIIALVPTWLQEFEKEAGYTMKTKWQRFWSNPYKWGLWHWIGGRPWTYISKDIWHQLEYIMQIAWFFIGVGVYIWLDWFGVLLFIIFYTFGYINGHFFWGKKYIPGQKGD